VGKELVIFGAWYFADVINELATSVGWSVVGRVDPCPPANVNVLESVPRRSQCFVAVGDSRLRALVSQRLHDEGHTIATLVHPSAIVSPSASIGSGSYLGENVVVRTRAQMGRGSVVNAGAVLSHHCVVGEYTMVGANSALAGRATVGSHCLIGVGASVRPTCQVGDDAVVGVGAAVIRDVPTGHTVLGNPARTVAEGASHHRGDQSDWNSHDVW
jgi:sugar O-acyltransferase (sialic acid O-acetyltransferase NeuD family)